MDSLKTRDTSSDGARDTVQEAPHRLKAMFQSAATPGDYVGAFNRNMARLIESLDRDSVGATIEAVEQAFEAGRTVYVMANGGSAAVASHFVNDMGVNSLVPGRRGCRVVSLADNVASITAVANDSGYESIFLFQLQCLLEPGDVVLAMSVSGNSPNILRAVEYARAGGARTIGFSGFDGGALRSSVDVSVHVPSSTDEYGPVEDAFSILCHIISGYITMKRGRFLHH